MAYEAFLQGTIATLLSTGMDSLANNALVAGSAYDNTQGGSGGLGYVLGEFELVVTFGTAPSANSVIALWLLSRPDGTNYEDGGASLTPARAPDVTFPIRAVTTAQRVVIIAPLRPGLFTPLVKNDATGQAFAASGNTVKVRPLTFEAV
jgi:hypothetical protein